MERMLLFHFSKEEYFASFKPAEKAGLKIQTIKFISASNGS